MRSDGIGVRLNLILTTMGESAPRKPLGSPSTKAADSSSSRASRQDKAKTAKIKTEKEEAAESSTLTVQKLKGDAPLCEVPSSFAVDNENQTVFFNTYDESDKNSEIFSCDLKTRTWTNITKAIRHLPHPIGSPERPQQLPSRYGGTMGFYKVQASGQRILLLFGGQVNGLKTDDLGEVSNELIAIDVDNLKWWVVDVAGGPVAARVEARLIIVDDQLFIFGGKTYTNGQFESTESYCVARFADYRWTWDVKDEHYPSHVPALGFCCDAVAIQDGDAQKILLTVVCTDNTDTVSSNILPAWPTGTTNDCQLVLNPTSFVLFDIGLRTFTPQVAASGNFPGSVTWYGISNLPGNLKSDPTSTSALICTFHADAAQKPELYVYSPQEGCKSLGLRKRIAATGRTFELFAVVGSKVYLFGWTEEKWDIVAEIPRRWISA